MALPKFSQGIAPKLRAVLLDVYARADVFGPDSPAQHLLITHPLFGAKCDAKTVGDVTATAGSTTITSPTAAFTRADIGKIASLRTGSTGILTTIASVPSATEAILAVAPTTSVTATGILTWGTDDTDALNAAIDACPPAGTVIIPGRTLISSTPDITKNLTLRGTGYGRVFAGVVDSGFGSGTSTPPYIEGSCLIQTTPATNALDITGTGVTVHLFDFGIMFAPHIMFLDTGHGVFARSSQMYNTGRENGPMSCRWDNITVWGHDGDHYAFHLTNGGHLSTFSHLQSQGGGGLYFGADADGTAGYGNSHFSHTFFEVITGGTAHGYHLDGGQILNNPSYGSRINLITFLRPQCNIGVVSYPKLDNLGIPPPLDSQYLWLNTGGTYTPKSIDLIAPDFETGGANLVDFGGFGSGTVVRRTGTMPAPQGGASTEFRSNRIYSGTAAPTLNVLTAAGTGATASWVNGHQLAGTLQMVLGSDTTAGDLIEITCPALPGTGIAAVFAQVLLPWGQANKTVFAKGVSANSKTFTLRTVEGFSASATIQVWVHVLPAYAFMGEQL